MEIGDNRGPFIEETRRCDHGKQFDDYCEQCEAEEKMEKKAEAESPNPTHTPGPWYVGASSVWEGNVYGPDGIIVAAVGKNYPNAQANAALIVKAPELQSRVEKLEAALRAIQKFGETMYRRSYAVYPDDAKAIIKLAGDGLK